MPRWLPVAHTPTPAQGAPTCSPQGTWRARLLPGSAQTPGQTPPLRRAASPAEGAGARVRPGPAPGGRGGGKRRAVLAAAFREPVAVVRTAPRWGRGSPLRARARRAPRVPAPALPEGRARADPRSRRRPLPCRRPSSLRPAAGGGVRPLPHSRLPLACSRAEPADAAGPPAAPGPWPAT